MGCAQDTESQLERLLYVAGTEDLKKSTPEWINLHMS